MAGKRAETGTAKSRKRRPQVVNVPTQMLKAFSDAVADIGNLVTASLVKECDSAGRCRTMLLMGVEIERDEWYGTEDENGPAQNGLLG